MPAVSLGKWSREENNFLSKSSNEERGEGGHCNTINTFVASAGQQQQQQQQQLGPGLPPDPSLLLRHPKCYAAASDLQARLTRLKTSLTTESRNDLITELSSRDASVSEDILSLPSL